MCQDNAVNYLQNLGYNVLRLPREGIEPLLLLSLENNLTVLGNLSEIMIKEAIPISRIKLEYDLKAEDINGLESSKFEINIGLKILEKILPLMGFPGIGFDLFYSHASKIEFQFKNVNQDRVVSLNDVARYIRVAIPDINDPTFETILDMTVDNPAYLIVETLKSNSLGVAAYDAEGIAVGVDVTNIENLIDVSTGVKIYSSTEEKVFYQGNKQLCFGFKSSPLWVEIRGGFPIIKTSPPKTFAEKPQFTPFSLDLDDPDSLSTVLVGRKGQLLKIKN
jgi:hypothetical protein